MTAALVSPSKRLPRWTCGPFLETLCSRRTKLSCRSARSGLRPFVSRTASHPQACRYSLPGSRSQPQNREIGCGCLLRTGACRLSETCTRMKGQAGLRGLRRPKDIGGTGHKSPLRRAGMEMPAVSCLDPSAEAASSQQQSAAESGHEAARADDASTRPQAKKLKRLTALRVRAANLDLRSGTAAPQAPRNGGANRSEPGLAGITPLDAPARSLQSPNYPGCGSGRSSCRTRRSGPGRAAGCHDRTWKLRGPPHQSPPAASSR